MLTCAKLLAQVAPPPIPLRPPAIPKRSKNEKPIPLQLTTRQSNQVTPCKTSDPSPTPSSGMSTAWNSVDSTNQKLIDLGAFRNQNQASQVILTVLHYFQRNPFKKANKL